MNSPCWKPSHPEKSNMHRFMQIIAQKFQPDIKNYWQLHAFSLEHPEKFWTELCTFFNITFYTPPTKICSTDTSMMDTRWFEGASFNFAEQLLKRRDDHPALISINEKGDRQQLSYSALFQSVIECAAGLKALGVKTGDRVAALMPNVPQTIIIMLASASLGAVFASCSPDFGLEAICDRFGQIEPVVLFASDGHCYSGKSFPAEDKLLAIKQRIPSIQNLIVCPFLHEPPAFSGYTSWADFLKPAKGMHFLSLPFNHPIYILFSSGTTGKPKCIVHGAGGTLLQHVKELGLHTDIHTTDNMLFYTTCGWMMWNWMVSTLSLGATLTLYEGSPCYPESDRLFRIVESEKVSVLGLGAKILTTLEKEQIYPKALLKTSNLRCILSTGSPLLPHNFDFVYERIKKDVQLCSISGGTDIISCFALGNPLLPVYKGELQSPGLGMRVEVFDEQGLAVKNTLGELVCTQAFPSMPLGFWNDEDNKRYEDAYFKHFKGIWTHGDFAKITENGGLIIYGRSDTVLNPGGIRIGTAEIYRQVQTIPEVADSVVISQDIEDDVRIVLFVKLQNSMTLDEDLIQSIKNTIRKNASPKHVPAIILQVPDIPRTINGKVVELAVRQIVHGKPVNNLESIANPEALEAFRGRKELKT